MSGTHSRKHTTHSQSAKEHTDRGWAQPTPPAVLPAQQLTTATQCRRHMRKRAEVAHKEALVTLVRSSADPHAHV